MRLDATYSNVSAASPRKNQSRGDMLRFLGADLFTVACAMLVGGALLFMPWFTATGGGTGLKYLFEGISAVPTKGLPLMLVIPAVAIIGVLATAWRLLDFKSGKLPTLVVMVA